MLKMGWFGVAWSFKVTGNSIKAPKSSKYGGRPRHQTEIFSGAHPGAGARIAYTRAMSEHRCFPKKRLSTHTMYFRHVTGGIRVSVTQPSTPASMEYTVAVWSYFDFLIPKCPEIPNFLSGNPDGT